MTPITILQLAATPWTLTCEDLRVTITAREACLAEDCSRTGSPKVDAVGVWAFDNGVMVRWRSNTNAEVSLDGKAWTDGALSFATPSEAPPSGVEVMATAYAGPAPGRWTKETVACDRSKPVWVFDPILREQVSVAVYPRHGGAWAIRSSVSVVMCDDAKGQYGGVP